MSDTTTTADPTVLLDPSNEDDRLAIQTETSMREQGIEPFKPAQQAIYFGFGAAKQAMFPDGVTYLEFKSLNEGERKAYLKSLDRTIRVQNITKDALMKTPYGEERAALFEQAVIGWNLLGVNGQPLQFSKKLLIEFIDQADPTLIDDLYKQIAEANPWLQNDISIEDIDAEIESLQNMRAKKLEAQEGKARS